LTFAMGGGKPITKGGKKTQRILISIRHGTGRGKTIRYKHNYVWDPG